LEEAGWELKRKILEFDAAEISLQRESDYSGFISREKKGANLHFMDSPEDESIGHINFNPKSTHEKLQTSPGRLISQESEFSPYTNFNHEENVSSIRHTSDIPERPRRPNDKYLSRKAQIVKASGYIRRVIHNVKDCKFCFKQRAFHSSVSATVLEDVRSLGQIIQQNLEMKFVTSREFYNTKVINDIIYNEPTNIVSQFKDYLIFDDVSEFLKRFYKTDEAVARLPRMYQFYEDFA